MGSQFAGKSLIGMGRRAYSRHAGISEAAVRKHIRNGVIKLEVDGSIDAKKADAALKNRTAHSGHTDPIVADARRRKLAEQVAALQAEVAELRASVIEPAKADALWRQMAEMIADRYMALAEEVGPRVAGKPVAEARAILDKAVRAALIELAGRADEFSL